MNIEEYIQAPKRHPGLTALFVGTTLLGGSAGGCVAWRDPTGGAGQADGAGPVNTAQCRALRK